MNRLLSALLALAFAGTLTLSVAMAQEGRNDTGNAMSKTSAGTTSTDTTFIKKAAQGGMAEVELGQMALQESIERRRQEVRPAHGR